MAPSYHPSTQQILGHMHPINLVIEGHVVPQYIPLYCVCIYNTVSLCITMWHLPRMNRRARGPASTLCSLHHTPVTCCIHYICSIPHTMLYTTHTVEGPVYIIAHTTACLISPDHWHCYGAVVLHTVPGGYHRSTNFFFGAPRVPDLQRYFTFIPHFTEGQ